MSHFKLSFDVISMIRKLKKVQKVAILGYFRVLLPIFCPFFGLFLPFSVRQFGVGIKGIIWTIFLNIWGHWSHFGPILGHFKPF